MSTMLGRKKTAAGSGERMISYADVSALIEQERLEVERIQATLRDSSPDPLAPVEEQTAHSEQFVHLEGRSDEILRVSRLFIEKFLAE